MMMSMDYSQLAVMSGPRDLRGAISWESIAHAKMGNPDAGLREAVFPPQIVRPDDDLLAQIPRIADASFVFVVADDRKVSGIVTTADLSVLFGRLAKPFFVLAEIEGRLRRVIDQHFEAEDLKQMVDPADPKRFAVRASDLTLGEIARVLEEPSRWSRLAWNIDRRIFIKDLKNICEIRNDVMHFDPDPLPDSDLDALRRFAQFLQRLQTLGVT